MISLFTYGIASTLLIALYCIDGHHIIKNMVFVKLEKLRQINKLVSTNYNGFFLITYISFRMVAQYMWESIIKYFYNSNIVQLEKNKYVITYIIKGQTYKMLLIHKRGPRKVLLIFDETQTDVSDIIFPYLGPNENFHGETYTPIFFGKDELIFELSDGNEKIFKSGEKIVI
jgi:hypothetical protein